jgi:Spy/CpxP family protein refolding chaperone
MPRLSTIVYAALLAAAASLSACSSTPAPVTEPLGGARPEPAVAPEQVGLRALDQLSLTAQQRTAVTALRGKLAEALAPAAEPRHELVHAMLAAIAHGYLEADGLATQQAALAQAVDKARPTLLAGLNELHALLTPEQRAALVDGLASGGKSSGEDRRARMQRLVGELDLTFAQKRRLFSVRDELAPERERFDQLKSALHEAAEAFKQDTFDASKLAIAHAPLVELWCEGFASLVKVMLPVLDDPQRAKLGALLQGMIQGS